MVAPAYTARGGEGGLGIGALVYRGQATVTTNYQAGRVQITAQIPVHDVGVAGLLSRKCGVSR
jgi:hypothetical protein